MNTRALVPTAIAIALCVGGEAVALGPAPSLTALALGLVLALVLLPLFLPAVLLRRRDYHSIVRVARILEIAPVLLYAITIAGLGWIELIDRLGLGDWPVVWVLVRLLPYALTRATAEMARKRVLAHLQADTASALAWAAIRLRQESLLFAPLVLLCAIEGLIGAGPLRPYRDLVSALHWAALFANVTLLMILFPVLLRWAFCLASLPPCRERAWIEQYFAANRFHVRDIVLSPGGSRSYYAALIGILPATRYLVISRALLELLSPAELEAVVAHEMGHGVRQHAGQAVRVAGTLMVLIYLSYVLVVEHRHPLQDLGDAGFDLPALLVVAAAILPAAAMMRTLLRHFELEADLFAATRTGRIDGLVCSLDKMASAIGMRRDHAGFRHPSIAARQRFLEDVFLGGAARNRERFCARLRRTRIVTVLVLVAALLVLARQVAAESALGCAVVAAERDRLPEARRFLELSLRIKRSSFPAWLALLELDLQSGAAGARSTLDAMLRLVPADASARGEIARAIDDLRAERLAGGDLTLADELRAAVLALSGPELR